MLVNFRYKGSPKSGNWGHAGRAGKVGGSAPKGVSAVAFSDNVFYHYTQSANIQSIMQNGFRVSGGNYGSGVYLTPDTSGSMSRQYTDTQIGVTVNVKNPAKVNVLELHAIEHKIDPQDQRDTTDILKELGYDALYLIRSGGRSPYLIVFDPKDITIISITEQKGLKIKFRYKGAA